MSCKINSQGKFFFVLAFNLYTCLNFIGHYSLLLLGREEFQILLDFIKPIEAHYNH